jgi:hypothetical protein
MGSCQILLGQRCVEVRVLAGNDPSIPHARHRFDIACLKQYRQTMSSSIVSEVVVLTKAHPWLALYSGLATSMCLAGIAWVMTDNVQAAVFGSLIGAVVYPMIATFVAAVSKKETWRHRATTALVVTLFLLCLFGAPLYWSGIAIYFLPLQLQTNFVVGATAITYALIIAMVLAPRLKSAKYSSLHRRRDS